MTPERERLDALFEVAASERERIPGSWWASLGRECAEVVPRVLAERDAEIGRLRSALARETQRADDNAEASAGLEEAIDALPEYMLAGGQGGTMTPEREAEIREALEDPSCDGADAAVRDLLAEIDRLRATVARVGEVVSEIGCECSGCDHTAHQEDHDNDCEVCATCRVVVALGWPR